MTWILDLSEAMSGWFALDGGERQPLRLELVASAPLWSPVTAPRPFSGTVLLGSTQEAVPANGTLTLLPGGPVYDFNFASAQLGQLHCAGRKHYSLRRLRESLITCPLQIYRGQTCVGTGEIKYLQPIWIFAPSALRLRRMPKDEAARRPMNAPDRSG